MTASGSSVAVLGAGSWGTALAIQLARAGRNTVLWSRNREQLDALSRERLNRRYLPEAAFPPGLTVTAGLPDAIDGVDDILVAVPSRAFREVVEAVAASGVPVRGLTWATKGFELETGLLPHQIVADLLPPDVPTGVISGPTFAAEVGAGLPSAMTIASASGAYARRLAEAITTETLRAYTSTDIMGVEVGAATKNVFAIGAGISDGLGFGANTRIALLTRGLAEMTRLGLALGACRDTFMGLAGMGDLVLTCTDDQSRNRRFGLALARGQSAEQARQDIGQVVEGYYGARSVHQVAQQHDVTMPIVEQIHRVLYENASPRDAVAALMRRPLTAELG